jgi:hypothetical protein
MDLKVTFIIYAESNGHDIYKKQRGPNKDANDRAIELHTDDKLLT